MLLELADVTKNFGGLGVLLDVSFNVDEGEILGLIRPNGVRVRTLFQCNTGIYSPNVGSIRYRGKNPVGLESHRIYRRGIAHY